MDVCGGVDVVWWMTSTGGEEDGTVDVDRVMVDIKWMYVVVLTWRTSDGGGGDVAGDVDRVWWM